MACNNKFRDQLDLEKIDFEPTTLIVGTFSPEWAGNELRWFYDHPATGRFWEVLPVLYGAQSLINATPGEWKQFCRDNRIAITNLISSIDDADPASKIHAGIFAGLSDKAIAYNFEDFVFTDVVQLLRRNPAIKNVYLTRGVTEAFWRYIWNPVMHYCSVNNLYERKLITPSAEADEQLQVYNSQHPNDQVPSLDEYILMKWRQEWHQNK
ncbi:MAG: hypothetical protein K0Q79_3174 [Flavipsychrobacter sp.]|jgi:hypothetical protein|nr:hypothetical protein [Flavipsychrobacter sp.]